MASFFVCFVLFRDPVCQSALSSPVNMRIPHANAFIDLNKDLTAGTFQTRRQCYQMS